MFDIGWSELLIFIVVTLLVIDREQLPTFLRTVGRYAGAVRRQADEFRSYFDSAIREAELESVKSEMESVRNNVESGLKEAEASASSVQQRVADDTTQRPTLSIDKSGTGKTSSGGADD